MIKISLVHSVAFVWLGKFIAPTRNWMHVTRQLNEYELMIVDSGTLYIADEEHEYEVNAGEYLLMRPCRKQHGYRASECSFHWIHFVYNEEFNQLPGDYIEIEEHGKIADLERIEKIFSEIYYIWKNYADRHYVSYLTTTLLMEIVNQNRLVKEPPAGDAGRGAVCRKVMAYIKWNSYITTKVSDIAEYLGYSEKYISAVFKKETGSSIRQYLAEQIVEKARDDLLNSSLTISQIAYNFGFSDVQNFSRTFKKVAGFPPSEFRNRFLTVYEKEKKQN